MDMALLKYTQAEKEKERQKGPSTSPVQIFSSIIKMNRQKQNKNEANLLCSILR